MKIKAKNFTKWRLFRANTGKVHIISPSEFKCACGKYAHSGNFPYGSEVSAISKSEVCGNCLKSTDAWEPVEDDIPLSVDRKLLEKAEAELEQKTQDFAEACKDLDVRCLKMKEECEILNLENEKLLAKLAGRERMIAVLQDATAGHSIENIATIMKAAPPAVDLEGFELALDEKTPLKREYWHCGTSSWQNNKIPGIYFTSLVRTPIVEWIENPTDEMVVKAGGRVPCMVAWEPDFIDEAPATLAAVQKDRFVIKDGGIQDDGSRREWAFRHCRVKKSDLEQS